MRRRVRAWSDDRHVAIKNVQQLGELVDAEPPNPIANPRHPRVPLLRLADSVAIFQDSHRSKFVDGERASVEPVPSLPEKDWSFGIELDRYRHHDHQR